MGLKIQKDANGEIRPTWWARLSVRGNIREFNLKVPIKGEVPVDEDGHVTLRKQGDAAFEKSRNAALAAYEKMRKEKQANPAEVQERIYKMRTGEDPCGLPLSKLAERWMRQKRSYTSDPEWARSVKARFERFARFAYKYAKAHNTHCDTLNDVTEKIAAEWFDELKEEFAWETVRKHMSLMRNAFRRYSTNGKANPFDDIILRNRETDNAKVSRVPLTAQQTQALFDAARDDERLYQLVIATACTGMRIGDVCNLKWADIDMREGLISVTTAKTGSQVTLPIFELLADVLRKRSALSGDGKAASPFVFPDMAAQYASNPDWIFKAIKPYFARAVYGEGVVERKNAVEVVAPKPEGDPKPLEAVIDGARFAPQKKERMLEIYKMRKAGTVCKDIAETLGIAKGQVSDYLREAEELTGETLRPMTAKLKSPRLTNMELANLTRKERATGKRAASIYGWHSLRATFVVLAIEAGVPLPDVQKIVGHSTAETTMQYFNPVRKHTAERVRRQMGGSVLNGRNPALPAAEPPAKPAKLSLDDLVAGLTERQKKALARKLLGL